mgnify:CR=1 FL=1
MKFVVTSVGRVLTNQNMSIGFKCKTWTNQRKFFMFKIDQSEIGLHLKVGNIPSTLLKLVNEIIQSINLMC